MKVALVLTVAVALAVSVIPAATASRYDEVKKVAVEIVYLNANSRYGDVWAYLHPRYKRVTNRAFWESCKRTLAKKRGLEFFDVRATDAYPDRVTLPLLGTIPVIAVTLQAHYLNHREGVDGGVGSASDTHLFVRVGSEWKALWTPEQYRAYKAHRCPAT